MTAKSDGDGVEEEFVRRAQLGDLLAFDRLVERYRLGCLWQANQILKSREAAEDAVQEAFLSAYKALPCLSDAKLFPAWLGSIVRNAALRLSKGQAKPWSPIDQVILAHTPALQAHLEFQAEVDEVCNALSQLEDDIKLPMELYYLQEWPIKRISSFLGVPDTTTKWRLNTGRKRIRAALPHLMEEPR